MAVYERIPYVQLTKQEQEALQDWCTLHEIDYNTVPIEAVIDRDPRNGDWLVETFDQRDGNTYADDYGNIVRVTLRRPFKADLCWPQRLVRSRTDEDQIREDQHKRIVELELENANLRLEHASMRGVVRLIQQEVDFFGQVAEDPDVPADKAEGLKQWCELLQAALDGTPFAGGAKERSR